MDAIALLMEEHQIILRTLDALDAFAAETSCGAEDKPELGRFVRFIREFADARHHGKEEDILFEAMVESGFPREAGPIAVMLMDHEAGRARLAVLRAKAEQIAPWSEADRVEIVDAALGYTGLLRSHIMKEDSILYPMAQHRVPAQVMERVEQECAAFERKQVAAGAEDLRSLAAELVSRHVASPQRRVSAGG
ncbi:MAG TPA: hemerythrin domain-containing protein [Anaeromyxobacteraceae bacterium]|nr:hemerythrin domain-containing protein [Anaeromyxobacteraceae bacterium]